MRLLAVSLAAFVALSAHAANISGGAAKVCDVRDYGARGDGLTLDTASIQSAIEACGANAGGGIVRLGGNGTFLSGPIELRSHVRLDIEGRSTLLAQHPPLRGSSRNITPAMVTAFSVQDVAVTGSGTIDGNEHSGPDEAEEAPVAIWFLSVLRGRIDGITISNSDRVGILGSREIHIGNVRITSKSAVHLHGISISGSSHLVLEHLSTSVGGFGLHLYVPNGSPVQPDPSMFDINITDCMFQNGQGMVIEAGSDVRAERLRFAGTVSGIRIKAMLTGVRDVSLSDIEMFGVATPIDLESASPIALTKISISNLKATGATSAGSIAGVAGSPITGLTLQNVSIEAESGLTVQDAQGSFDAVSVKAARGQGVLLSASASVERK